MYSDYDMQENDDGSWTAFQPDTSNEIITSESKQKLEWLMAQLNCAFCRGVVQGINDERERMKTVLGLQPEGTRARSARVLAIVMCF